MHDIDPRMLKHGKTTSLLKNDKKKSKTFLKKKCGTYCRTPTMVIIILIWDLSSTAAETTVTPIQQEAYNHFKKNTMSIELLKDDHLQKVNFRVKNKVHASLTPNLWAQCCNPQLFPPSGNRQKGAWRFQRFRTPTGNHCKTTERMEIWVSAQGCWNRGVKRTIPHYPPYFGKGAWYHFAPPLSEPSCIMHNVQLIWVLKSLEAFARWTFCPSPRFAFDTSCIDSFCYIQYSCVSS